MTRPTTWAVLSLGAAAIHFAVIPDHLSEWWAFGVFFAGLGWYQALWSIAYVLTPSARLAAAAIVVNLSTVVVWALSRSVGLPVGPHPGMPEAVGAADLIATALELGLVGGLLVVARRPGTQRPRMDAADRMRDARLIVAVGFVVAIGTTAAIAVGGA